MLLRRVSQLYGEKNNITPQMNYRIRDLSVKGKVRKLMEDNVEDTLSLRTGKGILKLLRLKQR